jgi:hypothetical protein
VEGEGAMSWKSMLRRLGGRRRRVDPEHCPDKNTTRVVALVIGDEPAPAEKDLPHMPRCPHCGSVHAMILREELVVVNAEGMPS